MLMHGHGHTHAQTELMHHEWDHLASGSKGERDSQISSQAVRAVDLEGWSVGAATSPYQTKKTRQTEAVITMCMCDEYLVDPRWPD